MSLRPAALTVSLRLGSCDSHQEWHLSAFSMCQISIYHITAGLPCLMTPKVFSACTCDAYIGFLSKGAGQGQHNTPALCYKLAP